MNNVKAALWIIVPVILIAGSIAAPIIIRHNTRETAREALEASPAAWSEERYVSTATTNCVEQGGVEETCRCVYSSLVSQFGVAETYAIDQARGEDNRIHTIVSSCSE